MNELTSVVLYVGAIGLIAIGIAGVVLSHNLFRIVLALSIAESGANLLLVLTGFRWNAAAPIIEGATQGNMVDPVPQAMVLTAIVIGVGVQALALAMAVRLRQAYGTLDVREIRARMEQDISDAANVVPPSSQEEPAGGRPLLPPGPAGLIASKGNPS
jgi:multisubunit Na+/H+ antiporter MnhC subunit